MPCSNPRLYAFQHSAQSKANESEEEKLDWNWVYITTVASLFFLLFSILAVLFAFILSPSVRLSFFMQAWMNGWWWYCMITRLQPSNWREAKSSRMDMQVSKYGNGDMDRKKNIDRVCITAVASLFFFSLSLLCFLQSFFLHLLPFLHARLYYNSLHFANLFSLSSLINKTKKWVKTKYKKPTDGRLESTT